MSSAQRAYCIQKTTWLRSQPSQSMKYFLKEHWCCKLHVNVLTVPKLTVWDIDSVLLNLKLLIKLPLECELIIMSVCVCVCVCEADSSCSSSSLTGTWSLNKDSLLNAESCFSLTYLLLESVNPSVLPARPNKDEWQQHWHTHAHIWQAVCVCVCVRWTDLVLTGS